MTARRRVCCSFVALLTSMTVGIILERPSNSAFDVGARSVLTCTPENEDSNVVWMEYQSVQGVQSIISTNDGINTAHPWAQHMSIEGQYNLVIDSLQSQFSGLFHCYVIYNDAEGTITRSGFAELITVESTTCYARSPDGPLEGQVVYEGVESTLTCRSQYTGRWAPTLEWYGENKLVTVNSTVPGEAVYEVAFIPTADMNGGIARCVALFFGPPLGTFPDLPAYSQMAPEYENNCDVILNVHYGPRSIEILTGPQNVTYKPGDVIRCSADSNPAPEYVWTRIQGAGADGFVGSDLVITKDQEGLNTYECTASLLIADQEKSLTAQITFEVSAEGAFVTEDPPDGAAEAGNVAAVAGGVTAGVIALIIMILIIVLYLKRKQLPKDERTLSRTLITTFNLKSQVPDAETGLSFASDVPEKTKQVKTGSSTAGSNTTRSSNPYYSDFPSSLSAAQSDKKKKKKKKPDYTGNQVDPDNITLVQKLGEGSFGQVWKAQVQNLPGQAAVTVAAVKTLRENASDKDKSDLLSEMKVMEQLIPHKNVVTLYGYCTLSDPVMVIVEFLSEGDLQEYLRRHRSQQLYADTKSAVTSSLDAKTLLSFALQVADGMTHISQSNLLHRDLAARNVLVGDGNICKVSDFGFARDVVDRHVYQRESQGPLPVRWMSPESLFDNIYTTKSDVWAFGVVIWEIVALGATPYPGLSSRQVMSAIRKGDLMERPEHCTDAVFDIMKQCWKKHADDRPSFAEVSRMLSSLLEEETDYLSLDTFNEDIYVNLPRNVTDEKV